MDDIEVDRLCEEEEAAARSANEAANSVANSESYRRRGCTAMRNVAIVAGGEVATRDVHAGIPTRHVCSASHRSRPTTVPSSSATQGILFATEPTTKGVASKHLEQLRPPPTPNPKRFLNVAHIAALKRMRAAESEGIGGVLAPGSASSVASRPMLMDSPAQRARPPLPACLTCEWKLATVNEC